MKQLLLILTFLACLNSNYGQATNEIIKDTVENKIYTKVDVEASFPGGKTAWLLFLKQNLNPMVAVDKGAQNGIYPVIVKFIVRKDSTVSDVYCESYPGYGVCEEGQRVIKKSKRWIPAIVNGQPVNSYKRQPITLLVEGL